MPEQVRSHAESHPANSRDFKGHPALSSSLADEELWPHLPVKCQRPHFLIGGHVE